MMTKLIAPLIILLFLAGNFAQGQENKALLDAKLELLDAKMKLLDNQLKTTETYTDGLEKKIKLLDSLTAATKNAQTPKEIETDSLQPKPFISAITINPLRLFEGGLQLSYERVITDALSLKAGIMGTYCTQQGLGNTYISNQELSYFDKSTNTYQSYNGKMVSGFGIIVQAQNYLLPRIHSDIKPPLGLYAAPQFMYRRIFLTGEEYSQEFNKTTEVTQNLHVMRFGLIIGGKFTIQDVLCVDVYLGGMMRMSKYVGESKITRYKQWRNIDYSGVMPVMGINFGIMK